MAGVLYVESRNGKIDYCNTDPRDLGHEIHEQIIDLALECQARGDVQVMNRLIFEDSQFGLVSTPKQLVDRRWDSDPLREYSAQVVTCSFSAWSNHTSDMLWHPRYRVDAMRSYAELTTAVWHVAATQWPGLARVEVTLGHRPVEKIYDGRRPLTVPGRWIAPTVRLVTLGDSPQLYQMGLFFVVSHRRYLDWYCEPDERGIRPEWYVRRRLADPTFKVPGIREFRERYRQRHKSTSLLGSP